jgi:hypothetical protein
MTSTKIVILEVRRYFLKTSDRIFVTKSGVTRDPRKALMEEVPKSNGKRPVALAIKTKMLSLHKGTISENMVKITDLAEVTQDEPIIAEAA